MPRHPKRYYHFTSRLWWRFIQKEGLRYGQVPNGGGRSLDHPNLTIDPDPAHQGWACSAGQTTWNGDRPTVWTNNKRAVRIAVELPPSDPRLIRWVDLARATGMDEWAIRRLDVAGGGHMGDWWIYRGVIRPKQFLSVDFLDGGRVAAIEQRAIDATRTARTSAYALSMMGEPRVV